MVSVRLVWAAARKPFLITALFQLVSACLMAGSLLVVRTLFGSAVSAGAGEGSVRVIVLPLALMAGIAVALEVCLTVENEQTRVIGELVARRAFDGVLDVTTRVELLEYEQPRFHDRLRRAQMQGQFRALQTVQGLLGLTGGVVGAIAVVTALTSLQPAVLPFVLLGYLPLWWVASRNTHDLYGFTFEMTPNDRERTYLQQVLISREPAKEVRSFNLGPYLRGRYDELYDARMVEVRALARRRLFRGVVGSLASSIGLLLGVSALAWLYVHGQLSFAAAGAAVFGLLQLSGRLRVVHSSAASLYEATIFVRDYDAFTKPGSPSADMKPAPHRFERLAVENVSFTYPGASHQALSDISLEIRSGEVIALVGENGSGKTTLSKVLAGLFPPSGGRILWDDIDVATVSSTKLRDAIGVTFQDFERYRLPARENIGLGDHQRMQDAAGIINAAQRADAHDFLSGLPEEYETRLGREFLGGFDLSVGQWQRVALARAFFRNAPFVILDEPTAALDARAEALLFQRIRELLHDRSVLLISHRLSSVRSADRIYVMQGGRIVEHGPHAKLIADAGLYADWFRLQASSYEA